jgi:L-rhamnose mutarotase
VLYAKLFAEATDLEAERMERPDGVFAGRPGSLNTDRKDDDMKRVGFLLKVKEDRIEEYKEHHKAVWPEMLDALRQTGWHNYSLFMRDDGLLFGYFETPESFQVALDGMAKEEINAKWQDFMAPYFEGLGAAHADESMIELEEVFHLD